MNSYILLFCQMVVILVFALSALGKIRDLKAFAESIRGFQLLPSALIHPAAIGFVAGELIVVVFLIFGGPLLTAGFVLASVLLLVFSGALISVLQRKLDVSCGCFGANDQPVSYYDIVRNGGFLLCAFGGSWLAMTAVLPGWDGWLLVGGAVAFVLIWTHLQDIVGVLQFEEQNIL